VSSILNLTHSSAASSLIGCSLEQAPRCLPFRQRPFALGSVDGHALQIDELKGTKPTEKIDLSGEMVDLLGRGEKLSVASAIIIASCIEENGVLKELKCVSARVFAFLSMPTDKKANTLWQPIMHHSDISCPCVSQRRPQQHHGRRSQPSGHGGARACRDDRVLRDPAHLAARE
jgi:hypothetical protein